MAARKRPKRARKPPPIDASLLYPTNPRRAFSWTPSAVVLVRDRFCFAPLFDREFRRFVPKKKIGVEKLVAAISSEQLNSCPWLKDLLRQDIEEIERRWRKTRVRRIFNDCLPQMKLGSYEALIRQSVSFQQLRAFISRCLHFLVPVTFIGPSNSTVLVEDFVQIIFSLNTREEIDLRRTFQKMKIGEIRWIKKTRCQPLQVVLLQDLVRFLLHLVLGCIVSVMKFVEVNKVRGSTVLYRYDVWRQLERKGLEEFMNVQQCKSVSMNERNAEVSSEMRFQVRTACLRPIVRISSEPHIALKRQANAILRYLIDKNQSPTFHSGSLTLFPRLLVNFRNSLPTNASQKIYMFTGDISNCFPCVNISHLKEILTNLIGDTPRFFVCSDSLFGGRYAAGLTQREACENLKNRAKNFDYGNLTYKQITTEQFLKILDMGRLVRYRDRYLRPHRGIGQGDHMSASLCSLYLASLEKSVEGFLDPAKTFSFRYADDYLLLSTDFEEIQSIILGLLCLFTINGLQMKEEKMSMNFDLFGSGETTSLRVVTWCGFTVSDRLDVKLDIERIKKQPFHVPVWPKDDIKSRKRKLAMRLKIIFFRKLEAVKMSSKTLAERKAAGDQVAAVAMKSALPKLAKFVRLHGVNKGTRTYLKRIRIWIRRGFPRNFII